jgi:hypothetical protein
MKKYLFFIFLAVVLFNDNVNAQSKKDVKNEIKEQLLEEKKYDVANEAYIKFKFQEHKPSTTRYNIKYFDKADKLEFWGHAKRRLSLLGPITVNLEGDDVHSFINNIWNTYKKYQSDIRKKQIAYEHMDINLINDPEVILSCYMNNRKTKYAFWVKKEKYEIEEKEFLELLAEMKMYFGLKK